MINQYNSIAIKSNYLITFFTFSSASVSCFPKVKPDFILHMGWFNHVYVSLIRWWARHVFCFQLRSYLSFMTLAPIFTSYFTTRRKRYCLFPREHAHLHILHNHVGEPLKKKSQKVEKVQQEGARDQRQKSGDGVRIYKLFPNVHVYSKCFS